MSETILIVDDEESMRRTLREWLDHSGFGCQVLTASDAESALLQAQKQTIDLAVLDWNLGAGMDGLQLLDDLHLFNEAIVAIMITAYANRATPLDAMRKGVRDYLEKNQELTRPSFLAAVRRQLDHIAPAKRERQVHQTLVAFREAVEKVLPLVQSAAALNDPVPLPVAVSRLFQFLLVTTGARDGILLVRSYDANRQPAEVCRVYDTAGKALTVDLVPFSRSIAGSVISMRETSVLNRLDQPAGVGGVELQPFERGVQSILAAPLAVAPGIQAVLELFDKQGPAGAEFTPADQRLASAAADFGTELLRQALAERQTHQVLLDAVGAALRVSDSLTASTRPDGHTAAEAPPPAAVLDQLRQSLSGTPGTSAVAAEETIRLAEGIRVLALRHGPAAVQHCIRLVEDLRQLLDSVTGIEDRGGR
jgi:two-component system, NtrC family, nitrogen regulation response regulator NtrX